VWVAIWQSFSTRERRKTSLSSNGRGGESAGTEFLLGIGS
jgi:hypothetical protein